MHMTKSKNQTALLPRTTSAAHALQISDRQRDVLDSLAIFGDWARPMDIGARDGSHHAMTLRALVDKRLAERRLRGSLLNQIRGSALYDRLAKIKRGRHAPRGSYVYRITRVGRKVLSA
jgi:hypothetical protein